MRTWAKVGLVFLLIVAGFGAMQSSRPRPEIEIKCETRGDSGHCQLENKGGASGDVDVNVVLVCRDGEHLAHMSARVDAHNHTTKIIEGFEPSVGLLSNCAGIDYRNFLIKPAGQ